jgi:hypothetical protein
MSTRGGKGIVVRLTISHLEADPGNKSGGKWSQPMFS